LVPDLYPRKMHLIPLESSFVRPAVGELEYDRHPKIVGLKNQVLWNESFHKEICFSKTGLGVNNVILLGSSK